MVDQFKSFNSPFQKVLKNKTIKPKGHFVALIFGQKSRPAHGWIPVLPL